MSYQPPNQQRPGGMPPGGQGGGMPQGQPQRPPAPPKELNFYELLQVDRDAHPTIIRYAYRFLAAMYHPDNSESGNAEKFRIITEAWRTLSDDGKRAAYDMSLGEKPAQPQAGGAMGAGSGASSSDFGKGSLPKIPKTGISFDEVELRLAILQILLSQRKKKPNTGGATAKMVMDILDINDVPVIEFAFWYLREKGYVEMGERVFMISVKGVDYIVDHLSKIQLTDGDNKTEQKINQMTRGGGGGDGSNLPVPARPQMPPPQRM
ncbi:MAG: J domain-containing protein [Cyanobacteria bacterium SZAS TMP-1]|nr:J domain-containing protein [Cyanobacteria bacterium SZAS TMP-1]